MEKCKIACLLIVCIYMFVGCQSTGAEMDGFIPCDYDMEWDDYVKNLMELKVDKDTLVIYTPFSYSNDGVMELNQLAREEGYAWKIQIRQVPDEYGLSMEELADALQDKKIQADILSSYGRGLITAARKGLFLDLGEYLNTESGKKLKEQLSEKFWELSEVDGHYYFIGTLDEPAPDGWAVNWELMEKYGFSEEDLAKPLEALEDVFQTVWEGEKNEPQYQIKVNGETIVDFSVFTMVPNSLIYRLPFSFADNTVDLPIGFWKDDAVYLSDGELEFVNVFDTERMRNLAGVLNEYYQKGYVKGSETGLGSSRNFFMQPDYSGSAVRREDPLDTWTNVNGIVLKQIAYYSQDVTNVNMLGNVILKSSAQQKEALEFLNFAMTDSIASDLLLYGKEGVDYKKRPDGMAEAGEYLDRREYSRRILGNMRISSPFFPYEDTHKTEIIDATLDALQNSPLYGFQFDITPVKAQVEAVQKIYNHVSHFDSMFLFEKSEEIEANTWEEYYDSYCQKLKDAGIDEVVEEMNRQLKKYLEQK